MKSLAIFSPVDGNYAIPGIIALESFRRYFPYHSYYIIGNRKLFNKNELEAIDSFNIQFIHCDKSDDFQNEHATWPATAYLMLLAPEIFYNEGYQYSLGIDADVLCHKNFNLDEILENTETFSGNANKPILDNVSKSRVDILDAKYGATAENKLLVNPNTGVVFWNNKFCHHSKLSLSLLKLHVEGYTAIDGDQSLLALYIYVNNISYNVLGPEYNYRTGNKTDLDLNMPIEDLIIIHYTSPKPWRWDQIKDCDTKYTNLWWDFIHTHIEILFSNSLTKKWIKNSGESKMTLLLRLLASLMRVLKTGRALK